jgi:flagellar motor protein MotB
MLVERYKIDADRIVTEGRGWDNPIDPEDPNKNRRVEVQFISLE